MIVKSPRVGLLGLTGIFVSAAAHAEFNLLDGNGYRLDGELELEGAVFQGHNSWFGVADEFVGADVDNWAEQAIQFGLVGETDLWGGKMFGEWTWLQTRTYGDDASGLTVGENDPNEFRVEQGHLGWTSGEGLFGLDEDALTIKAGRFDYNIGTGLLINDGAGDGGHRGGWWIGARKAFKGSVLASLRTGPLLAEAFYLKNAPRSGGITGKAQGVNLEYEFETLGLTAGGTYFRVGDNGSSVFEDFETLSLRATWETPWEGLTFDGEFAQQYHETDGEAFWLRGAYQWTDIDWLPEVSYRYAHLSGDDPGSDDDERFRTVAYGFTDYGSWYQGEIAGNYVLENSNLNSHMLRLQLFPNDDITVNFIYYKFLLDENQIFDDPVGDDDFGDEVDVTMDWAVNDRLYLIFVLGALAPGDAAKEWTGGDDDWLYSMVYASYSF